MRKPRLCSVLCQWNFGPSVVMVVFFGEMLLVTETCGCPFFYFWTSWYCNNLFKKKNFAQFLTVIYFNWLVSYFIVLKARVWFGCVWVWVLDISSILVIIPLFQVTWVYSILGCPKLLEHLSFWPKTNHLIKLILFFLLIYFLSSLPKNNFLKSRAVRKS